MANNFMQNVLLNDSAVLKTIVESIGDAVCVQDADLKVLYQNDAHKRLVNGDHYGDYCFKGYHHRDTACEGCPLVIVFRDGNVHSAVMSDTRDSGILLEITASPIRNAEGTIVAGIEVSRNITEYMRREQERDRLIRELHEALVERETKILKGIIPLCSSCKKVRDDGGVWEPIEYYISSHSNAEISHGLCPVCARRMYPDYSI